MLSITAVHALAWLSAVSALDSAAPHPTPAALCSDLFTQPHCEALGARCTEPGVAPYCHLSCGACDGTDDDAAEADATPGPEPIALNAPAATHVPKVATYIPEKAPILHLRPQLDGKEEHLSTSMFPQGRQGVAGSRPKRGPNPNPNPDPTPNPNPPPTPLPQPQPQP